MMEGERVINYIAKQEGYEIEKKDKFLTMKEQQHIEINKKIYSKFNNEELNNNKLIVIKKNKNKTVYHDLFPKISLQEAKLSYTLLGS
jgi:alanyl-tRNA synthetase